MQKKQFVAIDTNIALMLADQNDLAKDAIELVRARLREIQVLAPATVVQELVYQSKFDLDEKLRQLAQKALAGFSEQKIDAVQLDSVLEASVAKAAEALRHSGLIQFEERNDAYIVAESAALDCILLVSNDSHLLEIDHRGLTLIFREMDLPAPLIVSPRELIEKFYR